MKQQVDACARLGRSYEFAACRLPDCCRPREAQLGFWRHGDNYLLYFRPSVAYDGPDPRLRDFFGRGAVQRYACFDALMDCLHSLDSDALRPGEGQLCRRLRRELGTRVLGQDQAVEAAAFKLWSHISKREPLRPLSLIFYGPTGVGKSELGKAVAPALNRCLGLERYRLVWTELNTFTQAHSVYRLTGAPPGYVGYDDPPVLEEVRRCPHTVFMFDELDKAHPEVLKVFMSILDEGRCTARREDRQGNRELDFRHCVFLFTTNFDLSGAPRPSLGFAPQKPSSGPGPALSGPTGLAGRLFQAALGREYGLEIAQVAPDLAQALTPRDALSLRSTVPILEGLLTPVFLAHLPVFGRGIALRLTGPPDRMALVPT